MLRPLDPRLREAHIQLAGLALLGRNASRHREQILTKPVRRPAGRQMIGISADSFDHPTVGVVCGDSRDIGVEHKRIEYLACRRGIVGLDDGRQLPAQLLGVQGGSSFQLVA